LVVPWRATDCVHCSLRWRASRPQLKRDPLGATSLACTPLIAGNMRTHATTVFLLLALVGGSPSRSRCQTREIEPPWRTYLMPWLTHAGQPRPWRTDRRLAGYVEQGYPDDVLVLFGGADSLKGQKAEGMWVTVTAYDSTSGLFLAVLRNQPYAPLGIDEDDNVVFRIHPQLKRPVAVAFNGSYGDAGWTPTAAQGFFAMLRQGIRAYRLGNNGHNPPEIDRCISLLTPSMETAPSSARRDEAFVGHFTLGRCLAEKYQTEVAIRHFRAAISLDTNDLDSHMALLAELSVMTHHRPGELAPGDEQRWERDFLEELAIVRSQFGQDPGVQQVLTMLFDPAGEASVDSVWRPYLPKLRRVGYGVFRWKQR